MSRIDGMHVYLNELIKSYQCYLLYQSTWDQEIHQANKVDMFPCLILNGDIVKQKD